MRWVSAGWGDHSLTRIEDGSRYGSDHIFYGTIVWDGLQPGVYSCETNTLSDHILDPKEYHVELFRQNGTIVLENDKRPNLTIWKRDANGSAPIEGRYSSKRCGRMHHWPK